MQYTLIGRRSWPAAFLALSANVLNMIRVQSVNGARSAIKENLHGNYIKCCPEHRSNFLVGLVQREETSFQGYVIPPDVDSLRCLMSSRAATERLTRFDGVFKIWE